MNEYMLLIYNEIDHRKSWSKEQHQDFVNSCEKYIGNLQKNGQLKIAQPLTTEWKKFSNLNDKWKESSCIKKMVVQVGYYHIFAKNMEEAIAIAKDNPEFDYGNTAKVEVRPIKAHTPTKLN